MLFVFLFQNRNYLIRLDNDNERKLKLIETSIMLLALDDDVTQNHEEVLSF
jgi:hypothetical protein